MRWRKRWLPRFVHRECDQQMKEVRRFHAAKNKEVTEAANARISREAAEARERIAAARAEIEVQVRQRTEHAVRTAAIRTASERRTEREAAFVAGVEQGRAEALREGPPVMATDELARLLTPTPRGEECTKVRLNDREHAEAMVDHVLETAGVRTEPYACPVCPRQLFDRGKFWHVRTIRDPVEQAKRDAAKAHRAPKSPDRLALRLDPEQVRLMNARARGNVGDSGVEQFGSSSGS